MALPEFVSPVITYAGSPAMAYLIARSLWRATLALVIAMASIVAMKTSDEERRRTCLALVDNITRTSERSRGRAVGR